MIILPMTHELPERLNIAEWLLDARVREGRGNRPALLTDQGTLTYREVQELANRFGRLLHSAGVEPEQRVMIALPDGPEFVAALFGTLKVGAVAVMVNPQLTVDAIEYFYAYTRATVALVHRHTAPAFQGAHRGGGATHLKQIIIVGEPGTTRAIAGASPELETFPSHRDDAAIWLVSGGATGQPKAVVQSHGSFANTTLCYGQGVLGLTERDITLAVPKLFVGYATGSNLFFPFSVGAAAALFPEKSTAETLFAKIRRFRPTVLVNVPAMVNEMVAHPDTAEQDFSSLRLATSAGAALPAELYNRWKQAFNVELLDGLGTEEMWHIFISNRPGAVKPGTLGTVVPGFDVRVRDNLAHDLADGEVGMLWVRGDSRAIGYWQQMDQTKAAFRGEWYVSGDLVRRDADGYFTYCGRADEGDRGQRRLQ
jgi:acyl-coenzyme A synthetase/AMP-(fatty) acid ligase